MNTLKRLLAALFLRDKFVGQLAAAAAAALAAYLMTFVPGLPAIAQAVIGAALALPEGTVLTHGGLTAALTPIFLAAINAVLAEFVVRDNNRVLDNLADAGIYSGPRDGWVGPLAQDALERLTGYLRR
jgi:hypothetical protein